MKLRFLWVLLVLALAAGCANKPQLRSPRAASSAPPAFTGDFPMGLCLIPEMDYIPEVDTWPDCPTTGFEADTQQAIRDWQLKGAWVASQLNPAVVRELSHWARPQMMAYSRVPPLSQVFPALVAIDRDNRRLLFEATVDALPSQSPKVKRYLLLYLMYDRMSGQVFRATLTIRGETEE